MIRHKLAIFVLSRYAYTKIQQQTAVKSSERAAWYFSQDVGNCNSIELVSAVKPQMFKYRNTSIEQNIDCNRCASRLTNWITKIIIKPEMTLKTKKRTPYISKWFNVLRRINISSSFIITYDTLTRQSIFSNFQQSQDERSVNTQLLVIIR